MRRVTLWTIGLNPISSITCLAIGWLKLIELCILLASELSFWSFTIQIGPGTVVKSSVKVDPDLCLGIALRFGFVGSLGEADTNEQPVEHGKIGLGLSMADGTRSPRPGCADRMIGPDSPSNDDRRQHHRNRQIKVSTPRFPENLEGGSGVRVRHMLQEIACTGL